MKFLLNLYAEPVEEAVLAGELVCGQVFADPSITAAVRMRDGVATVTEGPYSPASDQPTGHYVIDCDGRERALELAVLILGGRDGGVEVRPLMDSAGMEM
ncbi:YciI family protein [Herbidospora mongoliensis]|uniref:YciI family protein n=1 Tax=Herbidospora mongoliensis TaxID=688067 RepID=UPI00082ACFFD|nr:hypothetical protein [Herbidospora mongoliensis]